MEKFARRTAKETRSTRGGERKRRRVIGDL